MIKCEIYNSNLLMHEIDYCHFIEYLNKLRKYNNFDENQYVGVFIERIGTYDYIKRIVGHSLVWNWQLISYNNDIDYVVLEVKLKNLLDNIHAYESLSNY